MKMVAQYCSKCGAHVRTVPSKRGVSGHHTCASCYRRYLTRKQAESRAQQLPEDKPPTFAQIGQALGISRSTAYVIYLRAMEKLRTTVDRKLVRELLAPEPSRSGATFGAMRRTVISKLPLRNYPIMRTKQQYGVGA